MAEEDEIDVLGDFNLDNFLSKNSTSISCSFDSDNPPLISQNSDLLNCDYTIHPQWLLDKPSANPDNWYDNSVTVSEDSQAEDCLGQVSTEDCITDESGWTEKEKNLLERGIEIFGKSNVRLSQFIGSKTASEVKYYLKNFYLENGSGYKGFTGVIEETAEANLISDVLDEKQIPASIEEVIAAVSTAKPTVPVNKTSRKRTTSYSNDLSEVAIKDIPPGHSLLKSNCVKFKLENIPLKTSRHKKAHKVKQPVNKKEKKVEKCVKFKFKTKFRMPLKDNKNKTASVSKSAVKLVVDPENHMRVNRVEITTGKGLAVPICEGEEIVKIEKTEEDSDLDIEVDIDDSYKDEIFSNKIVEPANNNHPKQEVNIAQISTNKLSTDANTCQDKKSMTQEKLNRGSDSVSIIHASTLSADVLMELHSMETPKHELILEEQTVMELEKVINNEYFEGRPTKTPSRYLKIRNHIISAWNSVAPNYVTKTSVRQGLKNCGDVNCISKIHSFLEQIGAINFGCAQVSYERPLVDMVQSSAPVREKPIKDTKIPEQRQFSELGPRPRFKKKFSNDGEGGCTLTHDDKGEIINTTIVNEEPVIKQRPYIKKPLVKLIYCRPFTAEKPQEYSITINLSALLQMDFHAHMCLSEVMGLVAGYWSHHSKSLTISHYEPCRNMASSSTHCDMCPISQAKAADCIHNKGLDILGWYHSHPTFAPEPSQQDLDTQQFVQQWIGYGRPCIGIILSPFSANGALIASPFRCMIVDKRHNFEDQFVPYKFRADVNTRGFLLTEFLSGMRRILSTSYETVGEGRVAFDKPYFQDVSMSYLEKFISSVRMHLAKCGTLDRTTCENMIKGIEVLVSEKFEV